MNYSFYMPVKIISGIGCVENNKELLSVGKKAFIVTGRHGAKACGALDDVTSALSSLGVEYEIFDRVTENPPVMTCFEGGRRASIIGADFVVGIGGGSAVDAAKAVAAYAANPDMEPDDIYDKEKRRNRSLPIIAVTTTAGTGSESNPFSVLSLEDGERKLSFNSEWSWPLFSFLDPKYTYSLSPYYTVSCAIDAFSHALESYLSPKANEQSSLFALYAAENIWDVLGDSPRGFTPEMREKLLYSSSAAGIAISITGTGFTHPLGYPLTMFDGVPHGRACGIFLADYLTYNEKSEIGAKKIGRFYSALGVEGDELKKTLTTLSDVSLSFTEDEMKSRLDTVRKAKNYKNSPYVINEDEMLDIYRSHFAEK